MDKMLSLYSGQNCPLCDQADELIQATLLNPDEDYQKVDVRQDHQLYHQYAISIPVLKRHDTQQELNWPFDQQQLIEFLS